MKKSLVNKLIVALIDMAIVCISGYLALVIRFEFKPYAINVVYLTRYFEYLPIAIVIAIVTFIVFKMYNYVWHFYSLSDVIQSVTGITVAYGITVTGSYILGMYQPKSVILMTYIFYLFLFIAERCSVRLYDGLKDYFKGIDRTLDRIMIIGAGDAADMIIRDIKNNKNKFGQVVCIIDDNPQKKGLSLQGINIVGNRFEIPTAVGKNKVTKIILAIANLDAKDRKEILEIANSTGVKVKVLPSVYQLYTGEITVNAIRDVEVSDLLGRDQITLENDLLKELIINKVILVTGAGGSIGSELTRQIASYGPSKLVLIDCYENSIYEIQQELIRKYGDKLNLEVDIASIRDKDRIYSLFSRVKPQIVFHAAAHKHVPLMEESPMEAIKNNIFGTYHVVRAAEDNKVDKFVFISTDKAVNPTNVMGATKRFCEMILQSRLNKDSNTVFCAVRFGNVLGSNGSVIPLFKKQIEQGGPVTITDKRITRFFMTIPEAVQLVLTAATMAHQNQLFVLDMGEPVKILDMAENLIRLSGKKPYEDIDIVEIGLRPGEKLYEELLMKSEHLVPTDNKKIFIEEQGDMNPDTIREYLQILDKALQDKVSDDELVGILRSMIPTYTPNRK